MKLLKYMFMLSCAMIISTLLTGCSGGEIIENITREYTISNEVELRAAFAGVRNNERVRINLANDIQLTGDAVQFPNGITGSSITIRTQPSAIRTQSSNRRSITRVSGSERHFIVMPHATLGLEDIIIQSQQSASDVSYPTVVRGGISIIGGTLGVNGAEIINNRWSNGGGVSVEGGGIFSSSNGIISNNFAVENGGGVFLQGNSTFNMNTDRISGNTATGNGGGIAMDNSRLNVSSSSISGNTATGDGGGIIATALPNQRSQINASNTQISQNTADRGGGLAISPIVITHLYGMTIQNNVGGNTFYLDELDIPVESLPNFQPSDENRVPVQRH